LRKGFGECPGLLPFGRDGAEGLVDDEFGGVELEAGGRFVIAEDVAEGLVGEVDQGHGFFAVQEIAFGESLLEGGAEIPRRCNLNLLIGSPHRFTLPDRDPINKR
jgi:hypothetical protein